MTKNYLSALFILLPLWGLSQGKISGTIQEKENGATIEYSTIALYKFQDSVPLTGTSSNEKGFFVIDNLAPGKYRLEITYLGFQKKVLDSLQLSASKPSLYLGRIELSPNSEVLEEVVIREEKNINQYSIDKKVYNPSKDLNVKGGNAIDVLQNIPSVQVDMDKNIQFRGSSNVTIFIDGKPSNLSGDRTAILAQIPAENIERIEIISNPSARYDAEGSGGIINIITKKGNQEGYSLNYSLNIGNNDKYQTNLLLAFRKGKWSLGASYSYNQQNQWSRSESYREANGNDTIAILDQNGKNYEINRSHTVRLNSDYFLNKKNTLSLSMGLNQANEKENDLINYFFYTPYVSLDSSGYRNGLTQTNNATWDAALSWKKTFDKPLKTWNTDLSFSSSMDEENLNARQQLFLPNWQLSSPDRGQITRRLRHNLLGTFQSDFSLPFGKREKVEAGVKAVLRSFDNDFHSESLIPGSEIYTNDAGLTNRFIYREQVYAAYASYTGATQQRWGYSAGLRLEQTFSSSEQVTNGQVVPNNYLSLFPSAFLSYTLREGHQLQVNYSRRVNRPQAGQLNPFANYTDPYNLRRGNPYLRPEFINSYEIAYSANTKRISYGATLFTRTTLKQITRFRRVDSLGVSTTSFENLDNSQSTGLEGVVQYGVTKWWKISANFSAYNVNMQATSLATGLVNSAWGGNLRLANNLTFKKGWSGQVSYSYFRPGWALQGLIKGFQALDMGMQKELFKGKSTLGIRVSDVLDTRRFQFDTRGEGFYQSNLWKRETRIFYLNFSYRFGSDKIAPAKRRPNSEGGGMDDF